MVQKTNSQAEARATIEAQEEIKKRAARQAAKVAIEPDIIPEVDCTVLPMGDGKISMGVHVAGFGTAHYEEGETFKTRLPNALELYERGFVNFSEARQASAANEGKRRARLAAQEAEDARVRELLDQA